MICNAFKPFSGRILRVGAVLGALAVLGTGSLSLALAQGPNRAGAPPKSRNANAGQYFVEFRSRYALSYGHTFVVHGRLNSRGQVGPIRPDQVAGLHPIGEGPQMWSVGHVLPVPSETGPSDGDLEEEYVSARYRVILSEPEYQRVAAHIQEMQHNTPLWHAVMYNCNAFVGDIAKFMGLKAPNNSLLLPPNYVNELAALNTTQ